MYMRALWQKRALNGGRGVGGRQILLGHILVYSYERETTYSTCTCMLNEILTIWWLKYSNHGVSGVTYGIL